MRPCIFVIGTRAQLVKVAPVLQIAHDSKLPHIVWLSGQHAESIDDLINDFALQSEFVRSSPASERSTIMSLVTWLPGSLRACYKYVRNAARDGKCRPIVVVHGDTLSTLASAVAGRLAGGDIVHLESGLTSEKLFDPFPEEILRRLTFRLTRYAVCPNEGSSNRMRRYRCHEIVNTTENTLLDCVRYALRTLGERLDREPGLYFVVSIHRFKNIYPKAKFTEIVREMLAVSGIGTVHFILHPPTEKRLVKLGLLKVLSDTPGVRLEPRMPYTRFVSLLANARAVFSDGGSNQEELSYLGVPTVLFRGRSERPDGLGENVVLRCRIGQELTGFIESGALDRLRRPRRLHTSIQPSRTSIDALCRWAADAPGSTV